MTEGPVLRVLIADDHPVVRLGVAGLINSLSNLELVGEADDGEHAIELFKQCRPDVVLMDLRMPGVDGVAAIERIRAIDPEAKVILLTTFDGEEDIFRGFRAGAKAYLLKDAPKDQILACIRSVHAGERYLPTDVATKLFDRLGSDGLSRRELEVLNHIASGKSNKEIARETGITEGTVKFHVTAIIAKLGVRSRTEAVSAALKRGLIAL